MIKTTGETIKNLREGMGITQAAVATYLKLDQSYISKIEADERTLTADVLEKLAMLFGYPPEKIASGEPLSASLSCAFRKNGFFQSDLEAIATINQIALNSEFMGELLSREDENGK
ncbi:MAG: helix-turn-helix transcriptional regulator [Victivallales bacterium]|nr:helix-turn-helix transcriptional regulator [Victivallales bacterium]